mgnify:CR=1 FL=1
MMKRRMWIVPAVLGGFLLRALVMVTGWMAGFVGAILRNQIHVSRKRDQGYANHSHCPIKFWIVRQPKQIVEHPWHCD